MAVKKINGHNIIAIIATVYQKQAKTRINKYQAWSRS